LAAVVACGPVAPPQTVRPASSVVAHSLSRHAHLRRLPAERRQALEPRPDLPRQLHSARYPLTVHWGAPTPESKARRLLQLAEKAWRIQVVEQGWPRPLADNG